MSIMPRKPKKLLYQLQHNLAINLGKEPYKRIFNAQDLDELNQDIGVDGKQLTDRDGRLVVSFKQPNTIVVAKGYRWDGCSPKFHILDLFWIGTPDGIIIGSERPLCRPDEDRDIPIIHERVTHKASCVHDVLGYCKYDQDMPRLFRADTSLGRQESAKSYGRRNRDKLFREMLRHQDHSLWRVYWLAVSTLGTLFNLIPFLNTANQPKNVLNACKPIE